MTLTNIPFQKFSYNPIHLFNDQWFLLTCGDFQEKKFNTMTISWGSIGVMWNKPFVQVVVRPSRYTYNFMDQYPDFTLCAFPKEAHKILQKLGAKSGRDIDKINHSGFTPCQSAVVKTPAFTEANLVIECRKMYWQDMLPAHFMDKTIETHYNGSNYHRIFFGEILAIKGTDAYIKELD